MSEVLDFSQFFSSEKLEFDLFPNEFGRNMATLGVQQDYSDIDELLDIDITGSNENSPVPCATGSLSDYPDMLDWYSDQSEITQQQYVSQMEIAQEKFRKENETNLLEALQKSMDMECNAVSELASLSSSLCHPPVSLSANPSALSTLSAPTMSLPPANISDKSDAEIDSLLSVDILNEPSSQEDVKKSDSSVLKQLLKDTEIHYPLEVDSNSNSMVDHVAVNVVPKPMTNSKSSAVKHSKKKKAKNGPVNNKPFTELLKLYKGSGSEKSLKKSSVSNSTRVVNESRYLRQYGSAPSSRLPSPTTKEAPLTLANQTSKVAARTRRVQLRRKQSAPASASAAKTSKAKALQGTVDKGLAQTKKNVIVASDASSLLEMLENDPQSDWSNSPAPEQPGETETQVRKARPLTDKRRAAVLIDALPHKRQRASIDSNDKTRLDESLSQPSTPGSVECIEKPSAEHDYCQPRRNQNEEGEESNGDDILSAAIQASGLAKKPAKESLEDVMAAKALPHKVVKFDDYLQMLRMGIRSAPNSPTSSPKITRGSARPVNNFMVGNASAVKAPAKSDSQLVKPILAAKAPKPKPALQLQGFEEYIAKIQNNHPEEDVERDVASVKSDETDKQSTPQTVAASPAQPTQPEPNGANSSEKQKRPKPRVRPVIVPKVPTSFVKIKSGGVIHTAAVTPVQTVPCSSAPLVMIKIPKMDSSGNIVGFSNVQGYTQAPATKPARDPPATNGKTIASSEDVNLRDLLKDPRIANSKPVAKARPAVLKAIPKAKWSASSADATVSKPKSKSPSTPGPTFKLVTSKKDGVETKSLVLSGVTGKLREILTLLAEQQKQQGATATPPDGEQQQETLQQLLSTVNNMNQPSSTAASVSTAASGSTSLAKSVTTCSVATAKTVSNSKKPAVPSPLSLIHEIKQNLSRKSETSSPASPKPRAQCIYTVPSATRQLQVQNNATVTAGGAILAVPRKTVSSLPKRKPELVQQTDAVPRQPSTEAALPSAPGDLYDNLCNSAPAKSKESLDVNDRSKSTDSQTFTADELKSIYMPSDTEPTLDDALFQEIPFIPTSERAKTARQATSKYDGANYVTHTDLGLASPSQFSFSNFETTSPTGGQRAALSPTVPPRSDSLDKTVACSFPGSAAKADEQVDLDKSIDVSAAPVSTAQTDAASSIGSDAISNDMLPELALCSGQSLLEATELAARSALEAERTTGSQSRKSKRIRIPLRRTMAASDLIDDGAKEVPFEVFPAIAESDPAQATLDVVEQTTVSQEDNTAGIDGILFNKLPAYLYSGKVLSTGTTTGKTVGSENSLPTLRGMKDPNSDPLISIEGRNSDQEELHYNKVPHYLRGGKACPRMRRSLLHRGASGSLASTNSSGLDNYPVLKRTAEGVLVNTNELYYSRLPSYYSAGRHHVVDTVTEPPREDDTVTPETMWKQEQKEKQRKREVHKKRKKKRSKQKKKKEEQLSRDRLLYSKIPHYLVAGRRSLVPDRRASEQSYSSSLSESSQSDDPDCTSSYRGRSLERDLPNASGRDRSASLSSLCSRSPSSSPRRSWRHEQSNRRSRSKKSPHCRTSRSYSSSDSEYAASRSRRRRRSYSSGSDCVAPKRRRRQEDPARNKKHRAIEERRVMYVGGINDDTTRSDLRRKFQRYGEIEEIGLYFRKGRDSYAFVTFRYKCDTFAAIERGNDDTSEPSYTLCFGGRREFCEMEYEDLDDAPANRDANDDVDFDTLLKQAMRR